MTTITDPMSALEILGHPIPDGMLRQPTYGIDKGRPYWQYETPFVGRVLLIAFAHLMLDDWEVVIFPAREGVRIRCRKPNR